jgi:hypothetical protein
MMRGIRRLAVITAATGLLAAGAAVTVSIEAAHAQTEVDSCSDPGASVSPASYQCTMTYTTPSTSGISVEAIDDSTAGNNEDVDIEITSLTCTYSTNTEEDQTPGGETAETPFTYDVPDLPLTAETGTCNIDVTASLPSTETAAGDTPDEFTAELFYDPIASDSTSATPTTTTTAAADVHPIKGYDSKCVDDNGNSSDNRAKIQIWSCSGTDQAENFSFSSNELKHNGKCLNDQADAGSGGHVVLYSCSSAANDKWSVLANGELKLKAHNGTLCLNDPRSSKTNGTGLIVYKCTDSANEKWSLP